MNEDLVNDKIELAKLYFKSKSYKKALSTYTQLVEHIATYTPANVARVLRAYNLPETPLIGKPHHPRLSSILDARAATYEKLGDVSQSLADSQSSLKVNPLDLKAYLRIGKNYLKMGDEIKAFRNYQCGHYLVSKFLQKHTDYSINRDLLGKLEQAYSKLNSHLKRKRQLQTQLEKQLPLKKAKKSIDPFDRLELDVLETIFGHLNVANLFSCHLVCKSWYNTLISFVQLYQSISLKPKIKYKEFLNGVNMFNRLKKYSLSWKINQTSLPEFWKIIDSMIKHNFKLKSLEVFNEFNYYDLLLKLDKYGFKFHFKYVENLKLILSACPPSQLMNLFPNLRSMEIILMESQASPPLIIDNKNAFKKLISQEVELESCLEILVLINKNSISNYPPFLSHTVNLRKLIISNFEFNNIQHNFGSFLSNCSNLKYLTLENNRNLSFKIFLQNLINYRSDFKLLKLVFREHAIDSSSNLAEFTISDFHNLSELIYLDLYSISLSNNGLKKFLTCCPLLETLILGASNFIYFKNDSINQFIKLNLLDLLMVLPCLRNLSLIDLNLDNLSMSYFCKDLQKFQTQLDYLDLSFNNKVDGIGLLSLLDYDMKLKQLILDGIQVNADTLSLIQSRYGITVKNDHLKSKWRQYGINSFILP
ncbi:DNA-binding SCF ubiquitin ligase subunit dia2 [Yamadazyma tenuis]|uniref:F-box domain-containing protein n=1 Tax=Candida tenuis (strain ATCC 10573 / BCRC 21748 / CBS 615 / JCM 9827 / NBRC 10315 / NRRL Y-1498 / VKM Y-70) TaxID=590646 RepID=G3B739_CANTC|nr:uncharacterized protein CANTEDRAFT_93861 [Yamadazyma tenuis ATCC 10573]EGV63091.1 hypothetical protein CANTEDRAFT_93861 [Yamadazyma tenuis ATCC 10573]WEJ97092.1 DNA-binding SCF ubiquitin ligase subunit dia2 [Yamadazyma tenuis]